MLQLIAKNYVILLRDNPDNIPTVIKATEIFNFAINSSVSIFLF